MQNAIDMSIESLKVGGGPFGAAITTTSGEIVATAHNKVTLTNDPTAHAEVLAIRKACSKLKTHNLKGHILYTSCEPCPMCMGACYWAGLDHIVYANTRDDAALIGFDDAFIYEELNKPIKQRRLKMIHEPSEEAFEAFVLWTKKHDKIHY